MKPKIFDITPKISPRLAVWPGDVPFRRDVALAFAQGHHLELSSVQATLHLGAHADAPSHYHAEGATIEARDPALYLGPAQVVRVRGLAPGSRVTKDDLRGREIRAPRVLFDTASYPDPDRWNGDFNSLSTELLEYLADEGVRLVGIDTPSVDPMDCKTLDAHAVLYRRDLAVLEGLVLRDVPEGEYTLIAPPLRLEGADASPVRALLVQGALT